MPSARRAEALVQGLFAAVLTGVAVLAPFTAGARLEWNWFVLLAGIMTFPVATLLYYMTAYAFTSRAELASQFARVKPLFSIILAVAILHEPLPYPTIVSAVFVLAGLLLMGLGAAKGHFTWLSLWLGIATAAAWSLGELFVGLGFPKGSGVVPTWMSLLAAALVMLPLVLVASFRRPLCASDAKWLGYFCAHGAISFALAYTLFFRSIATVGLTATVLVTAFWPVIAMLFSAALARSRGERYELAPTMWAAAVLLLVGSLIQPLLLR